jgi:sporulation protein YlmC with PRC-barrel domain
MLKKYLATALIGSALLAPMAYAETPATTTDSTRVAPMNSANTSANRGEWRASKIVGLNVYNNNNEKVGAIDELLTDRNGAVKAVVIGVGGFLGMGEHLVAIPFDKIKFVDTPVSATTASDTTTTRPAANTTTGAATTTTTTTSATTSSVKADWYPDHAVFNATKDELKAMPEFKYAS